MEMKIFQGNLEIASVDLFLGNEWFLNLFFSIETDETDFHFTVETSTFQGSFLSTTPIPPNQMLTIEGSD